MVSNGFVIELGGEVNNKIYAIRQIKEAMCFHRMCGQKAREAFPRKGGERTDGRSN